MTFNIKNGDFKGALKLIFKYRNELGLTKAHLEACTIYEKPSVIKRKKALNKIKQASMGNRSYHKVKSRASTEEYFTEPTKKPIELV